MLAAGPQVQHNIFLNFSRNRSFPKAYTIGLKAELIKIIVERAFHDQKCTWRVIVFHDEVRWFSQIASSKDDTDSGNSQGDSLSHFHHALQKNHN